jgi:hypothetical protein
MGDAARSLPSPFAPSLIGFTANKKRGEYVDVARIEALEKELDTFIERRAKGAKTGRERANEEAQHWREKNVRHRDAVRLSYTPVRGVSTTGA